MDRTAHLILNKVFFGAAPYDLEGLQQLINNGFNIFIDLVVPGETYPDKRPVLQYQPYVTNYYRFSIRDRGAPSDLASFHQFMIHLGSIYQNSASKIYIHCKGGHGRSGLVAACLLLKELQMTPQNALEQVNLAHHNRTTMQPKYRKLGSPQTKAQKEFVHQYYRYLIQYHLLA